MGATHLRGHASRRHGAIRDDGRRGSGMARRETRGRDDGRAEACRARVSRVRRCERSFRRPEGPQAALNDDAEISLHVLEKCFSRKPSTCHAPKASNRHFLKTTSPVIFGAVEKSNSSVAVSGHSSPFVLKSVATSALLLETSPRAHCTRAAWACSVFADALVRSKCSCERSRHLRDRSRRASPPLTRADASDRIAKSVVSPNTPVRDDA